MAYIAAHYQSNWTYERGGSDFDANVGALLSDGADLQASCATQQLRTRPSASAQHRPKGSGNVNDNPYKSSGPAAPWGGPRPGFAWVDEHGTPLALGPPAAACLTAGPASRSNSNMSPGSSLTPSCAPQGMAASQRSMALWERVSPGMMPDNTKTPAATTAEAFAYAAALVEPVDFTHHLKRTDFAAYTECKLRHMHHIQAAAKK